MSRTIEDDIRAALREGTANEETRQEWARVAMSESEPPRRRIRPMWPLAVAATIGAIVFWPRAEEIVPAPNMGPPEGSSVVEARKINEAFLDSFEAKFKDTWIVVTGEMKITVGPTPAKALQRAPDAVHRFVFTTQGDYYRRGDIIGDRAPVKTQSAGLWFFQHAKLDIKKHKKLSLKVNGKKMSFEVVPKSMAPLLLPKGTTFPKFEIPGRMILEDMNRNWIAHRRYLVHVQSDDPKLDLWTEAIGDAEWAGVRLGTKVFHKLDGDPHAMAKKAKRPLVVLHVKEGSQDYLHELFTGLELGNALQYAVKAKTTGLVWYRENGKLTGTLPLSDAAAKTKRAITEAIARNK